MGIPAVLTGNRRPTAPSGISGPPPRLFQFVTISATRPERVAELRAQIAKHQSACGCELGSVFALASLIGLVAYLMAGDPGWSVAGTLCRGLAWVVGFSLVGKVLGLGYAQLRLVQLRADLRRLCVLLPDPGRG